MLTTRGDWGMLGAVGGACVALLLGHLKPGCGGGADGGVAGHLERTARRLRHAVIDHRTSDDDGDNDDGGGRGW